MGFIERLRKREVPFLHAQTWAQRQPANRWQRMRVADGDKGPRDVLALTARVRARQASGVGAEERLLVIRTCEADPRTHYALVHADPEVPLETLVRVQARRHAIEELFEAAKGEAGLAHYEVRSWIGWHHHMTLALLALWFLILERRRLGEKNTRANGPANAPNLLALAS